MSLRLPAAMGVERHELLQGVEASRFIQSTLPPRSRRAAWSDIVPAVLLRQTGQSLGDRATQRAEGPAHGRDGQGVASAPGGLGESRRLARDLLAAAVKDAPAGFEGHVASRRAIKSRDVDDHLISDALEASPRG